MHGVDDERCAWTLGQPAATRKAGDKTVHGVLACMVAKLTWAPSAGPRRAAPRGHAGATQLARAGRVYVRATFAGGKATTRHATM